jgi:hypothetical protein
VLVRLSKASRVKAISLIALVASFLLVVPASALPLLTALAPLLDAGRQTPANHHHGDEAACHDVDSRMSAKKAPETHTSHCSTCGSSSCECYGLCCDLVVTGAPQSSAKSSVTLPQLFVRLQQQTKSQIAIFIDRPPKSRSSL